MNLRNQKLFVFALISALGLAAGLTSSKAQAQTEESIFQKAWFEWQTTKADSIEKVVDWIRTRPTQCQMTVQSYVSSVTDSSNEWTDSTIKPQLDLRDNRVSPYLAVVRYQHRMAFATVKDGRVDTSIDWRIEHNLYDTDYYDADESFGFDRYNNLWVKVEVTALTTRLYSAIYKCIDLPID